MSLKYNGNNIQLAKNLRKNSTPQENHLWYDFLRYCTPKFRRQEIIGNYIADFYCHKAKLVIEIDGLQHYTMVGKQKDEFRTEILEGYDLKIIRFTNKQIDDNFLAVCKYIDKAVIGQMSVPDMRHCVQYALSHPERCEATTKELDLFSQGKLTFAKPDTDTFRCLQLCIDAINEGGLAPAAVNGANEEAVALYFRPIGG